MSLVFTDVAVFLVFVLFVISFSMFKSRSERTGEDFFLASRQLTWPLIGLSLIAANISTEQFVGMNGQAAGDVGLAVASYDWLEAITLVIVAWYFLPLLLRTGIYTVPEFLEYRFNSAARGIMSFYMMIIYVAVTIAAVLYSGGLTLNTIFDMDLTLAVWMVGLVAALYTAWGGLKAVAWADLFLCSSLLIGGFIVMGLGFNEIGGVDEFMAANSEKMHVALPTDHMILPWTALLFGLWIPNMYYWGFNQYIVQRSLGARSLKDGQLGVLMAAGIQVILPLIIVVPGLIAYQLYSNEIDANPDQAFPLLIRHLVPVGFRGFVFAAIFGAIISSLASMLNSASTIFTMDIFKRHIKPDLQQKTIVLVGRIMTIIFVVIGCLIAPKLANPKFNGVFYYIQDFQGYVMPSVLACFLFGFFIRRAPALAAVTALLANFPVYGILHLSPEFLEKIGLDGKFVWLDKMAFTFGNIAFLNKMAITFTVIILAMTLITLLKPLKKPVVMPVQEKFDMTKTPSVMWIGSAIIVVTIALYVIFW